MFPALTARAPFVAALAVLVLTALPRGAAGQEGPVPAPSSKAEARVAELRRVLRELRLGRQDFERTQRERARLLEDLEARRDEAHLANRARERKLDRARKELAALTTRGQALEEQVEARKAVLARCHREVKGAARTLRSFVEQGIPFEIEERLEPVKAFLARKPEGGPSEGARDLQRLYDYEISLGTSASAFQGRITLETGERPRTRFLRVGLVYMAFLTEDGSAAGVLQAIEDPLSQSRTYGWRSGFDYFQRWRIRQAMEIAEKRRPPSVLSMPVYLNTVRRAP